MQRYLTACLLALGLLFLAGCSSPSVITLKDGREIQAVDSPWYDSHSGFYEYEEWDGTRTQINRDAVLSIQEL